MGRGKQSVEEGFNCHAGIESAEGDCAARVANEAGFGETKGSSSVKAVAEGDGIILACVAVNTLAYQLHSLSGPGSYLAC